MFTGFSKRRRELSPLVKGNPLVIYASDLAAAAGYNQYKSADDLISKYTGTYVDPLENLVTKLPEDIQEQIQNAQEFPAIDLCVFNEEEKKELFDPIRAQAIVSEKIEKGLLPEGTKA